MNLLQRVVHRKSFGRNTKERPATSPYSNPWGEGSPGESDTILGGSAITSPMNEIPPPLPTHSSPTSEKKGFFQRPMANGNLRRSSAITHRRQSTLGLGEEDHDDQVLRDSVEAMRRLGANDSPSPQISLPAVRQQQPLLANSDDNHESSELMRDTTNALGGLTVDDMPRARQSWLMPSTVSSYNTESSRPAPPSEKESSFVVLPRYPAAEPKEDNLFDSAQLASQWAEKPTRPDTAPTQKGKVMTTAQFEKYRQEQERLKSIGYRKPDSVVDEEEDNYEDDDEDEEEKRREQARQRKKQEAHMTVYRQQMMKITGDVMNQPQRPGIAQTQSTPNLALGADVPDVEDEDEDIPLAILQAHGFPNKNRAPGQLNGMSSNPNLRGSILAGTNGPSSVAGGRASVLPAFARRLPQDPYNYGAAIVNPTNRESLAFGSGSQYGGGQARPVAGGLVGVIASEERSRAMRRGSPNAQGEYPAMPANLMGTAPPPGMMNRQSMMGGPMMQGAGGMPFSADPAMMQAQMAQMQAQLQQSMEMQLQFFNMMSGAPPPPVQGMPGSQGPGSVYGMPPSQHGFSRASTMGNLQPNYLGVDTNSRPGSAHNGRPFTVADPNFATLGNRSSFMPTGGNGYASSITPSERSNVGQPGRYRPVSHMPQSSSNLDNRSSTMMSGGVGGWDGSRTSLTGAKPSGPTVRILPAEPEEDEEKGWEEMRQKQAKKKSVWRSKKKENDLGDFAQFTS